MCCFFINLTFSILHRFFVDIRLYNKARAVIEPFAFDKYRKDKIRQQIEAARPNRLQIKSNLPKVNQDLALKYLDDKETAATAKKKKGATTNLLDDSRFKAMFENPEFEIDKNAMEYKMLTPVLSRLDKTKVKQLKRQAMQAEFDELTAEDREAKSSDEDFFSERDDDDDESSDDDADDRTLSRDMKKQFKQIKRDNRKAEKMEEDDDNNDEEDVRTVEEPKMVEVASNEFKVKSVRKKNDK